MVPFAKWEFIVGRLGTSRPTTELEDTLYEQIEHNNGEPGAGEGTKNFEIVFPWLRNGEDVLSELRRRFHPIERIASPFKRHDAINDRHQKFLFNKLQH